MKKMFKKFVTMAMATAMVFSMTAMVGLTDAKAEEAKKKTVEFNVTMPEGKTGLAFQGWCGVDVSDATKVQFGTLSSKWGAEGSDGYKTEVVKIDNNKLTVSLNQTDKDYKYAGFQVIAYSTDDAVQKQIDNEKTDTEVYKTFEKLMTDDNCKAIKVTITDFSKPMVVEDATAATGDDNATTEKKDDAKVNDNTPKTADTKPLVLFGAIGAVSLVGVIAAVALRKKTA